MNHEEKDPKGAGKKSIRRLESKGRNSQKAETVKRHYESKRQIKTHKL